MTHCSLTPATHLLSLVPLASFSWVRGTPPHTIFSTPLSDCSHIFFHTHTSLGHYTSILPPQVEQFTHTHIVIHTPLIVTMHATHLLSHLSQIPSLSRYIHMAPSPRSLPTPMFYHLSHCCHPLHGKWGREYVQCALSEGSSLQWGSSSAFCYDLPAHIYICTLRGRLTGRVFSTRWGVGHSLHIASLFSHASLGGDLLLPHYKHTHFTTLCFLSHLCSMEHCHVSFSPYRCWTGRTLSRTLSLCWHFPISHTGRGRATLRCFAAGGACTPTVLLSKFQVGQTGLPLTHHHTPCREGSHSLLPFGISLHDYHCTISLGYTHTVGPLSLSLFSPHSCGLVHTHHLLSRPLFTHTHTARAPHSLTHGGDHSLSPLILSGMTHTLLHARSFLSPCALHTPPRTHASLKFHTFLSLHRHTLI